jgi:hypothetical protein
MTLIPAYGRDYKSRKAVLVDWMADKDFIEALSGKPINRSQCAGQDRVVIRYGRLRRCCQVPT